MNGLKLQEPVMAMTAYQGRGLSTEFPPRALNMEDCSDYRLRSNSQLFCSSSIVGAKNHHALLFSLPIRNNVLKKLELLTTTYSIPYLYVTLHDDKYYCACLKPVSTERYNKVLKAAKSESLKELEKYGHVLYPLLGTPSKMLVGTGERAPVSLPHYIMITKLNKGLAGALLGTS